MNDPQQSELPTTPSALVDNTASYKKRFLAFLIDFILMAIALMFVMRSLGLEPVDATDLQSAQTQLMAKLEVLSESQMMLLSFSPFIIFFALHGVPLYQRGQTLGKRIMGIAIVTLDNQKPAFFPLIAQRYMTQWLMGMVPTLGIVLRLVDILIIFRREKRCLHDLIARTKVIDLSVKMVAAVPNSLIA
jgi:uncharacterized RDD family membrane protein YckC